VFVPDDANPLKALSGLHPNGFYAMIADGSVRFLSEKIDLEMLGAPEPSVFQ